MNIQYPPLPSSVAFNRRPENNWLELPTENDRRPANDFRSAEKIINDNPILKRVLTQRNRYQTTDQLKRNVGDWTSSNPDTQDRADVAYRLARVLNFLDNVNDRRVGNSVPGDGRINGYHNHGYSTLRNSEAELLVAFAEKGYTALRGLGERF